MEAVADELDEALKEGARNRLAAALEEEPQVEIAARKGSPFAPQKYNRQQRRAMAAAQRRSAWAKIVRAATNAATKKAYAEADKRAAEVAAEQLAMDAEDALD